MSWFYLTLAILTEVAGTTSMKLSEGFARFLPSVLIFVFYGISFSFTTLALKKIDLSIVYPTWSGVGTALITIIGFLYFKDQATPLRIISICLIVIGVIGLNWGGGSQ